VVTYPQLRESADRIAGFLRYKGVHTGDVAAIVMPRSIDYSVRDSGAKLIIDEELFHKAISFDAVPQNEPVSEQTPAIVFYTSGSTGRPKGVLHDQESIGECIERLLELTQLKNTDVIGAVAPFEFAAHMNDTVRAMCSRASCIVIPRDIVMDPNEMAEYIERYRITHIYLPPKIAKLFHKKGNSLKHIYTGCEPVRQIAPDGYRLFNMYAMSEMNVVTAFEIDKAYDNTPFRQARALYDTGAYGKNGRTSAQLKR